MEAKQKYIYIEITLFLPVFSSSYSVCALERTEIKLFSFVISPLVQRHIAVHHSCSVRTVQVQQHVVSGWDEGENFSPYFLINHLIITRCVALYHGHHCSQ